MQLPGLAMNWMAPVPLHGCLLTPPGSINLCILVLFTNSKIAASFSFQHARHARLGAANAQMRLVQGTRSQPPLLVHEVGHVSRVK